MRFPCPQRLIWCLASAVRAIRSSIFVLALSAGPARGWRRLAGYGARPDEFSQQWLPFRRQFSPWAPTSKGCPSLSFSVSVSLSLSVSLSINHLCADIGRLLVESCAREREIERERERVGETVGRIMRFSVLNAAAHTSSDHCRAQGSEFWNARVAGYVILVRCRSN